MAKINSVCFVWCRETKTMQPVTPNTASCAEAPDDFVLGWNPYAKLPRPAAAPAQDTRQTSQLA
jgi:hypothetical protein